MLNNTSARNVLVLWSLVMFAAALWVPPSYWTIDDGIKSIAARQGDRPWGSPVADDSLRGRLSDPTLYPVFVPPFAERMDSGIAPGFSPYARLFAGIEEWASRQVLIVIAAVIAIGLAWTLFMAGVQWGFLFLPLTFYGLVPWEHGLALSLSTTALVIIFLRVSNSPAVALLNGVLLASATALRLEHGLLLPASLAFLFLNHRSKEALITAIAGVVALGTLIGLAGWEEMSRQIFLNRTIADWSLGARASAAFDMLFSFGPSSALAVISSALAVMMTVILLFSFGPSAALAVMMTVILLLSLMALDRAKPSRLTNGLGWTGVVFFLWMCVRVVWGRRYPPIEMLHTGSFLFAMPWILWLFTKRAAWKTKAMAYATALLVVGIVLTPQSSGVHWGPRLLLFTAPLFAIALYQAKLHRTRAFAAIVLLSLFQAVHSGVVVYARYVESQDHEMLVRKHGGTPMITTTRAQAIDLAGLWGEQEFFVASTEADLKRLLTEFYQMRRDSVWLHLISADSLLIKTFPNNRPVWPHKMSIVNCGRTYRSQWRVYQIVMNRADPEWIPLLEQAAERALKSGDEKRALFLQNDILRIDPDRAEAHSNMAFLLARMGKTYDAQKAVERALELDSTLLQARALRARLEAGGTK